MPEGDEDGDNENDDDDTVMTTTSKESNGADLESALRECIAGVDGMSSDDLQNETESAKSSERNNSDEVKRGLGLLEALSFSLTSSRSQTRGSAPLNGQGHATRGEEEFVQREESAITTEKTRLLAGDRSESSSSGEDEDTEEDETDCRVPRTKNEEVLAPSIFTTMADIGRDPKYR